MNKTILYILVTVFVMGACKKQLDLSPLDQISQTSYWQTGNDLVLADNYLYTGINDNWQVDIQSEDCFGNTPNPVSSGTNTTSNTDAVWTNSYAYIRWANVVLQNYRLVQTPDSIKNRYAAEAKFFRAFYYFQLLQRFGNVPLIMTPLDLNSSQLYGPATDRSIVVDTIVSDLQSATPYLPLQKNLVATDIGRITSGTAQAFLSRVALYEGTRAKYYSYGDPATLLTLSKTAALNVIVSGQYTLFSNFLTMFYQANNDNAETILSYRYSSAVSGGNAYNPRIRNVLLGGVNLTPTKFLADAFRCTDGLPITSSPLFQGYTTSQSEFNNRDPRMAMEIWKPGDPYNGAPFVPDLTNTRTGYWSKKYADPIGFAQANVYTNEILIRYAEVLLNYAEATYESSGSISDADLDLSINLLRARAGMPGLTNAFAGGANSAGVTLNMLDEIRNERRVELAEEGFRYNDLIRWKTAATELPQAILGDRFHQADYPNIRAGVDIILTSDSLIIAQSASSRIFTDPKNYLFPIPLQELSLDPQLSQNPGW